MIRLLFILSIIALNFFSSVEGWARYAFMGFFIVFSLFCDFFIVRRIPFYRVMTFFLSWVASSAALYFTVRTFSISTEIGHVPPEYVNLFVLNLGLCLLFFSLLLGATSTYFRKHADEISGHTFFVVDTSAIIDGRIVDICESGFLSPHLIIPEFVIKELQLISDSSNHEKRKKGRRGLELLKRMKNSDKLSIQISNIDYGDIKGVDNKLLMVAKEEKASIVTIDYNLMKVAEVEGLKVININQLATILKPLYSTGDKLKVTVVKKGSNPGQGVGYLDDDTMVVIEDGERFINQQKNVIVTSYVQNNSGKMVFCKII